MSQSILLTYRISGTSAEIGSVSRMYELLAQAAIDVPVSGNENGSYMTMKSNQVGVLRSPTYNSRVQISLRVSFLEPRRCFQGLRVCFVIRVRMYAHGVELFSLPYAGYWQRVNNVFLRYRHMYTDRCPY